MRKKALSGGAVLLAAALGVGGWNYFGAHRPVSQRLAEDTRNEKVKFWTYHLYGVLPGTLVVDLRGLDDEAAMMDVMRGLFQAADAHKERRFDKVLLSYKGTAKFQLDGEFFQTLGKEYEHQNPRLYAAHVPGEGV